METFLSKHEGEVIGTHSGFDRLVFRGAEVSQAANNRYVHALASLEETTSVGELADGPCRPAT